MFNIKSLVALCSKDKDMGEITGKKIGDCLINSDI